MIITLVRAPLTLSEYASAAPAVPPIGLAYIAATTRAHGHEVHVVDSIGEAIESYVPFVEKTLYRGLGLDEIVDRVPNSDVIGVSVMFSQDWPLANELIRKLKDRQPKSIIVIGGEHAAAEPVGALEDCPSLDYAIVGEGDYAFPDLLRVLDKKESVEGVGSLYYRDASGEIRSTAKLPRSRDLSDIPWPAWDLFPLENYLKDGHGWGVNRGRSMPIVASRGCPYQCTFCSNPFMWTTRWVARPVEDVIKEIECYIEEYKATNFDFQDLTAIVKKNWIKTFCLSLIEKGIDITWQLPTGTRTEAIDEEVAGLLFRSGCKNITYAPESGSNEVLKRIKKKIKLESVYQSARGCIKAGLDVKFNFIFGFPEDRYRNLFESTYFMLRLAYIGVSDISIAPFSPYPGSELFFQLQKSGKIPKKLDEDYYRKIPFSDMSGTVSWCERINSKNLNRARNVAMILFYLVSFIFHPSRPFKRLFNFMVGREETRMDKALGDMKRRLRLLRKKKKSLKPGSVQPF
jgi:anaerobic magnesium-protoporphyrin IX monomethyl ester cyclase